MDRKQLFENHLYLAERMTKKYHGFGKRGIEFEDLHQEALLALYKASEIYDPSLNVPFIPYAVNMIRFSLLKYFYKQNYLKTSRSVVETAATINKRNMNDWHPSDIAQELGITVESVTKALQHMQQKPPKSIYERVLNNDKQNITVLDTIPDKKENDWIVKLDFEAFINDLEPEIKKILELRQQGIKQKDIGKIFGISQVKVSRLIREAKQEYIEFIS